ncbi:(p)ppGpp synthetase I SpoT/RelA [Desulfitobacterium sp. LBE]|uniref:GTP diphosphokinase n=5 Tax=root TaxID=1 RepID=Q24UQ2_DESHY|nr:MULTISPECIES: bifunctional (p)ppGpp synthetase/guanosine-3',5'-bis(diphosphate) 3'-pyrophosphohydrolase [Desulfitobacterium]ACL21626.1 (p)ppGpp synthetase I, SpoT/RelA [Desulfitobacterium hafniense DCB-2]EHL07687.1 GTP diphosphokinase [Desulfitobacterium hafniense DP7]KTE89717.1 (p)ppGpp synthetase [Desulfitobacterium hafniense]MEA5023306.1 bifunctional (p)ppGpp synthetase/guanosine-3',5'-bis(diphosphate) 3'-pyrophosphohydrolase [Desulfitobacterium hafniense]TWH60593.1 (p)ppGpp synthetase I
MTISELMEKLHKASPEGIKLVEKAYSFAEEAHRGQLRNSGEEYIQHPLEVAKILLELEMDEATIAAAFLHDVVEDTHYTNEDIEREFGSQVAILVDGVTKLGRIEYKSKEELQVENLRKMFLAMAKDIRVILIKLADRLHNMRTLKFHSEKKQKEIALETLEIFAPLANRLGIFRIKWELEDLSFRYLKPQEYYDLSEGIALKRAEREVQINEVISQLSKRLAEVGIKADISGRPKHFYSIYRKMINQHRELSEIYDLTAVRVIVDSVNDCYGALGIIHTMWKPLPGRFKDYIAMPKPNMYQSLHTTLVGAHGEPFEIQIRTWEMHRTAEYGIAAHWKYKEGAGKPVGGNFEQKLSWLRQMLEWQHDSPDAGEFMESLKIDLFADTVFVFTPKGDVVELPAGSCPVDFAYRVHTDVGHRCVGAKINSRIVPLETKLANGDIVEILTSKQSNGPSRDWLSFVKTSQAKNRIRGWFKKEKREENIVRGREGIEREVRKLGLDPAQVLKSDLLLKIGKSYNITNVEDLYAAMGDGAVTVNKVLVRLKEDLTKDERERLQLEALQQGEGKPSSGYGKASQGVRVKGVDNILVRFSRCCNPLPGDDIVGYITRGRGVSIHRRECDNVKAHSQEEQARMVEVIWDTEVESIYPVDLEIFALDRPRLVTDVMNVVMETRTNILGINARVAKDKNTHIQLSIEIRNLGHLYNVMQKIRRVKDVTSVERVHLGGR